MFKALFDKTDITEVRRHEDRLRKRLEKLGFRLTKGETVKRSSHLKQLKHELRSRGYKITNILTGDVECGGKYDLTLEEVEAFWLREYNKWNIAKWQEKRKRREGQAIKAEKWCFCLNYTLFS